MDGFCIYLKVRQMTFLSAYLHCIALIQTNSILKDNPPCFLSLVLLSAGAIQEEQLRQEQSREANSKFVAAQKSQNKHDQQVARLREADQKAKAEQLAALRKSVYEDRKQELIGMAREGTAASLDVQNPLES